MHDMIPALSTHSSQPQGSLNPDWLPHCDDQLPEATGMMSKQNVVPTEVWVPERGLRLTEHWRRTTNHGTRI